MLMQAQPIAQLKHSVWKSSCENLIYETGSPSHRLWRGWVVHLQQYINGGVFPQSSYSIISKFD